MHVVEVRRDGDALSGPMAEMREWLDDKHIEPTLFRLSLILAALCSSLSSDRLPKRRFLRTRSAATLSAKPLHAPPDGAFLDHEGQRQHGHWPENTSFYGGDFSVALGPDALTVITLQSWIASAGLTGSTV